MKLARKYNGKLMKQKKRMNNMTKFEISYEYSSCYTIEADSYDLAKKYAIEESEYSHERYERLDSFIEEDDVIIIEIKEDQQAEIRRLYMIIYDALNQAKYSKNTYIENILKRALEKDLII